MRYQIKSIFEQIAQPIFKINDVVKAKQFVAEFVVEKNINDKDKQLILNNIQNCKNITAVHRYICNSLLKYEGMSVNKPGKEDGGAPNIEATVE